MTLGKPSWNEDQLVPVLRNHRLEEVYWTYGYSPVFCESGEVGGTLVVCTETTSRVLTERRLHVLRKLAEMTAFADGAALFRLASEVFATADHDLPFALIYRCDKGAYALAESVGLDPESTDAADRALRERLSLLAVSATGVELSLAPLALPGGPWPERTDRVYFEPISRGAAGDGEPVLVFGLSPRLPFDEPYRDFLRQLGEQLSSARARTHAFRVRAAAEAERNDLLRLAPVAMALLSGPELVFELANPAFAAILGGRQLAGFPCFTAIPEVRGTSIETILRRAYTTGEPYVADEYKVPLDLQQNGALEDRYFRFSLAPVRDGDMVSGLIVVAVDITEQVSARRVLERASQERESLLRELESASSAKDEFLAMLGHELRNPLSPIVTALELVKLRAGGHTTREHDVIERQVNHLVRLVDDLLDVSRITRGKVELRKETVELSSVLEKAVEVVSTLFEQRHHRLDLRVPASGLTWTGDPVRLAQVVANLLTNAARYTDPGGTVELTARRDGSEIVITVEDDGTGISPELLPTIFDPFVQGKRRADRAQGGLGIGLALVKNLVELHGGTVMASSDGHHQGSLFTIRLPDLVTKLEEGPVSTPKLDTPRAFTGSRRVLVVDDNVDAAELLGDVLRSAGHEVAVVNDPLAALNAFDDFSPNVAVLDIGLPVMDGYELAERIREIPCAADCRLIALTGYGQRQDHEKSGEAGFYSHLVKPVDVYELVELVGRP
jgi:signal transduction histidine kinase